MRHETSFMRFTAVATRWGSSASSAKGLAVFTAQKPQARVQRSPAIMKVAGGKAYVVRGDAVREAGRGTVVATLPEGAEDVVNNNRMRRELETAMAALRLFSPDADERAGAIAALVVSSGLFRTLWEIKFRV